LCRVNTAAIGKNLDWGLIVPELITTFFTSEEYEHWMIGVAAAGAVITITIMVIIIVRLFRDK